MGSAAHCGAENFERDTGLKAYKAWMDKEDRHPYWGKAGHLRPGTFQVAPKLPARRLREAQFVAIVTPSERAIPD